MSKLDRAQYVFQPALVEFARAFNDELGKVESLADFNLEINISGRISKRQPTISFKLAKDSYGTDSVIGGDPQSVLKEFLHRLGWKEVNKPQMLPAPSMDSNGGGLDEDTTF